MPNNHRKQWSQAWLALGLAWELGWTIAIPVVSLTLLGKYIDIQLGFKFLFIIIGGILGISSGIYLVYKKANKIQKKIREHNNKLNSNNNSI